MFCIFLFSVSFLLVFSSIPSNALELFWLFEGIELKRQTNSEKRTNNLEKTKTKPFGKHQSFSSEFYLFGFL